MWICGEDYSQNAVHVPSFGTTIELLLRRMPTLSVGIPIFIVGTLVRLSRCAAML
jgi:hypothetical protein